jgi:hypothetical protein
MVLAAAGAASFAYPYTFWQFIGAVLVATSVLQIAYFVGAGTRYLPATRTSVTDSGFPAASRPHGVPTIRQL